VVTIAVRAILLMKLSTP